jgi:hypothetical protein
MCFIYRMRTLNNSVYITEMFCQQIAPSQQSWGTHAVLVIHNEWKNRSFICGNSSQTWDFSYFLLSFSGSNPLDPSKIFSTNLSLLNCVFSGFRREADESCALLGYYAASSGNFFPTFRDNISVPSSGYKNPKTWILNLEDGTDGLS